MNKYSKIFEFKHEEDTDKMKIEDLTSYIGKLKQIQQSLFDSIKKETDYNTLNEVNKQRKESIVIYFCYF